MHLLILKDGVFYSGGFAKEEFKLLLGRSKARADAAPQNGCDFDMIRCIKIGFLAFIFELRSLAHSWGVA